MTSYFIILDLTTANFSYLIIDDILSSLVGACRSSMICAVKATFSVFTAAQLTKK
jgi:hypothetical protein